MRRAFASAVVQVVSMLLIITAPATASVDITLLGRSTTATADFTSTDSTGCVTTSVHVEAGDGLVFQNPPAHPVPVGSAATVFIQLSAVNTCTGESFDRIGGNQGAIDFSWDHRLNRTTVRGTATLFEVDSGGSVISSFDVAVDLAWIGVGDVIRVNGAFEYRSGGFLINTQNHVEVRLAEAAGTISDGITNLTPASSINALMVWGGAHQVTVHCVAPGCQ